ncbi:hypothetical protein SAMN06265795_10975 [Noviherbaspirillum humi]|uniref:Proteasome-type protease n=1 Tax=Noviherbaspirillum humi TaxID=1688639 RepID=A0A239IEN2_9BURK|nr:hypothetical protein [Noviherbaspirillum humi]SNS92015.1 hypothetical protein SAMN06265795_10975 [Noviherbaspirillum humi]
MTVLVSVKINDGVVMAADSASSFASGMVYYHSHKIMNVHAALPVGVMATGAGGIGSESVETLLKDLRNRLSGNDSQHLEWRLDPSNYSMEAIARRLRAFLFEEKSIAHGATTYTKFRLCGYSAGRPLAEIWEVNLMGQDCPLPRCVQGEQEFGLRWDGEYEALDRLVFGLGTRFNEFAVKHGLSEEQANALREKLVPDLYELLFVDAMPIQDAIDLARYLAETTVGFIRYSVPRPKTVGGPIEIASITKHEGFQWAQRTPEPEI